MQQTKSILEKWFDYVNKDFLTHVEVILSFIVIINLINNYNI